MPTVAPVLVGAAPHVPADEVHIPAPLADSLGIVTGENVRVAAGCLQFPGRAVIVRTAKGATAPQLLFGDELLRRLHLSRGTRLHVRWDEEQKELRIGPFVGVLALQGRRGTLYGELDPFFRALTRTGAGLGIGTYMFSPRDVDWQRSRVLGYVYAGAWPVGRWMRGSFPLPDVVYDRVQTRRIEAGAAYARFRRRLGEQVPRSFNETGFFDKWTTHHRLIESEKLRRYLPDTELYEGPADLERFLDAYATVYVKPVDGSLGLGIVRIQRRGGAFRVTYEPGDLKIVRRIGSMPRLTRFIHRALGRRTFVIQQGLPLATWRGRPFDVRILAQRTAGGRWTLTKMFGRVAAPGSFISNLSRGGDGVNVDLLLRRVFRRTHGTMQKRLRQIGIELAQEIETIFPGTVGELGLDLGIDRRGRIWIIEVNSKPFLQMTREAGSPRTLALSVRRPLRFGKFLAGFETPPFPKES